MNVKTIMLAEDDEDDRYLFSGFVLERKDIILLHATENGMEMIDFLNDMPNENDFPDLIVLDQNMPKMSGIETLQSLKSNGRYSRIPIAIYTTYADKKLIQECHDAGAMMIVEKPSSPHGYRVMIDQLISLIIIEA